MPTGRFTKAQRDLLKMFSKEVPDADRETIRDYAKHYFAERATQQMDKLFEANGWGDEKIEEWANTHMRTPYKK